MNLNKRLKRLEAKLLPEKKIIVIKFGNEIKKLKFKGEIFNRLEYESEAEFIERSKELVCSIPERSYISILVSNF